MSAITPAEWQAILQKLGVKSATAQDWSEAFASEVQPDKFSQGEGEIVSWLPQILHECSMLEVLEERLSYSTERLMAVWPSRFPDREQASLYAGEPEKLANRVYGGRMGNTHPGDGWKYRGRCPIMITGLSAYLHCGPLVGQDLDVTPETACAKHFGLQIAVRWWENDVPDEFLSDQVKLRRRVNGGTIGLEHVQALHQLCIEAFA